MLIHYLAKILILASSTSIDSISTKQYIRAPCAFTKKTSPQTFSKAFLAKKWKSCFFLCLSRSSALKRRTLTILSMLDVLFKQSIALCLFSSKNFMQELSIVSMVDSWTSGTGVWNCVSSILYEIVPQQSTTDSRSNIGRSSTVVATTWTAPGQIESIFFQKWSFCNCQNIESPQISTSSFTNG